MELDWNFGSAKRKIALMINRCTAHRHVENLEWIELIFLLPKAMSYTQLMDRDLNFKT